MTRPSLSWLSCLLVSVACNRALPTPAAPAGPANPAAPAAPAGVFAPAVDHHQHLISPALARLWSAKTTAATLPDDLAALVADLERDWNDAAGLAGRYAADGILIEPRSADVVHGRAAIAARLSHLFQAAYRLVPAAAHLAGAAGMLDLYLERTVDGALVPFAEEVLAVERGADGWRVVAQTLKVPGPEVLASFGASDLISLLDQAGIRRAVILSGAYAWSDKSLAPSPDEDAHVRAENDWNAQQVALYPDRLVLFCAVSPIRDYALDEIRRCASELHARGLKLHFSNSGVVLTDPAHLRAVRAVFAEADRLGLPIVAHLQTETAFGAREAEIFLTEVLPEAPHIVVQLAHMSGSGPGWNDEALGVFADAIARRDPRTAKLYFDVATNADGQSYARLALLATRIREIGTGRILYGSDASFEGHLTPRQEWATFQGFVPLSPAEIAAIAGNVAPYLR